jgi:hypothetical protein
MQIALSGMKLQFSQLASVTTSTLFLFLLSAVSGHAQGQTKSPNSRDGEDPIESRRLSQPLDLAIDNYKHLAAAPRQIQEVLLKDSGLLV